MIYFEHEFRRGIIDIDVPHLLIESQFGEEWLVTVDYRAPNLAMLSESFRDAIGYGPAVDVLLTHEVPHDSALWTLGHKGGDTHWRQG